MHDLRDYNTLTARQITTAIGQLSHNTAPKIMTHLALRARQPPPLGNGRSRAAFFKIVVAQSCFKQPLSAPARVSRAAPDLASRHR